MKTFNILAVAFALGAVPLLAGCTTTSDPKKVASVSINNGNFQSAQPVGNDIRSILTKGGLDARNPSSVAEQGKPPGPETLSTTATDLKTLVAQLDAKQASPAAPVKETAQAAPAAAPQVAKAQPAVTPITPPLQALALAETNNPDHDTETYSSTRYQTIGNPVGDLAPDVPFPAVDAAVKAPVPTPAPAPDRHAAAPKKPRVVEEASSYKAPTVKRF